MLNQRKLFLASRLFVAASKAGYSFDLARFSNDAQYAMATITELLEKASEPSLQPLIAEVAVELTSDPSMHSAPTIDPSVASAPIEGDDAPKRYVGRLR